ncbi:unnamed protein product [Periconia digitata]|uniref:Uncharacterized protein n=1 Tax=Periconia digitata TaxID=1303443 RepID=A0A9W4UEN6_9PLEO|nr:unnamed protein product [Periconia digitata]
MRNVIFLLASAIAFTGVSASPTEAIFGRHVGDSCKGGEGSGTCQATSKCNGISYPLGYCPNDPVDVQCCVEIACKQSAGFCRSVSNNGCSGGSFESGFCPGDNDIKCCIKSKDSSPGTPTPPPSSGGQLPGLSATSSKYAHIIASRVHALGLPKRACLVAIATAQQESGIRVLANTGEPASYNYPHDGEGSDHDSVGIFQQRPGWGTVKDRMDPASSADKFLNRLKTVSNWQSLSIAQAAQKVQVSAFPDAYAKWETLATNVCNAAF